MSVHPKKPQVSVVIPAFNEEGYLSKALGGLINQNVKPDEVIIVDNNSVDKTKEIALSYAKKFKNKGIKYIVVKEEKPGSSYARNKGFFMAKSPIIASMDADTIPHRNWIGNIIRHFDKNDSVAVTGITIIKDSSNLIEYLSNTNWYKYLTMILKAVYGFQTITTANAAIKADAFRKVSGFDVGYCFPDDLEDTELSSRLCEIGNVRMDTSLRSDGSFRRYQPITKAFSSSLRRIRSWIRISNNFKTRQKSVN